MSAQGVDERKINVHYYYKVLWALFLSHENGTLEKYFIIIIEILAAAVTIN